MPVGTKGAVVDSPRRMLTSRLVGPQPRGNMRPRRRGEAKVTRHVEPKPNLPSDQRPGFDRIRKGHSPGSHLGRIVAEFSQLTEEVRLRHDYETGVAPVERAMKRMR